MTCASHIMREQTGLEVTAEVVTRTTENFIEGEHCITLFVLCGFPTGENKLPTIEYK